MKVDVTYRIHKRISPFDYLSANLELFTKVPPEGDTGKSKPHKLSDANAKDGELVFPCKVRDSTKLLVECYRRDGDKRPSLGFPR